MPDNYFSPSPDDHYGEYSIPDFFAVADRFVELYVSYRQRYVLMVNGSIFIPKKKDSSPTPLSNSIVCKHLNKRFAIGVFAGAYSSKFVCFDVDDGNQDTVRKIIALSERFGIPKEYIYVSSSGGKGYHVEVFFDSLVYTEKMRIYYDWIVINGRMDPNKVEFRPTSTQAIKLPLSVHAKTGNICWYLNRDTFEPYTYDSYVLEIKQFSVATFNSLVDTCGLRKPISGNDDIYLPAEASPKTRVMTEQELQLINGTSQYPDITAPGQRHTLTRAIAIHNRRIGMTLEESEEALIKWWEIQDKTITSTPDGEAIEDIRDLVAWTFSEKFIIPHRIKRLEITQDLMRATLAMDTKTTKKLMFLIGCFCNVYGRMNMGYERIAKYLGCSAITVRGLISKLAEEGWIKVVTSKTTFSDGKYVKKPNTYYITSEAFEGTRDLKVTFCFNDPLVYEAKECSVPDDSGRLRIIIPELEPEGFTDFYYLTIRQTVAQKSLKDFLSRSEIKALRNRKPISKN